MYERMRLGGGTHTQLCPLMTSIFSKVINLEQAKHEMMMYPQDSSDVSIASGGSVRSVQNQAEPHSSEPPAAEGEPAPEVRKHIIQNHSSDASALEAPHLYLYQSGGAVRAGCTHNDSSAFSLPSSVGTGPLISRAERKSRSHETALSKTDMMILRLLLAHNASSAPCSSPPSLQRSIAWQYSLNRAH